MRVYATTDVGRQRNTNQDYVFATGGKIGPLHNLLIVADGMGGHQGGDFASCFVVEGLWRIIKDAETKPIIAVLNDSISRIHSMLREEAAGHDELWNMGTTLVAATVEEGRLYVANVGDSRLYVIGNGIIQLTKDHSLVEEMVQNGKISRDDARDHHKKNIITRAVGIDHQINIDFFEWDLSPDDKVLLCSDGLTNMLSDDEIYEIVKGSNDLSNIAETLVNAANQAGGRDNISVVLADDLFDKSCIGEVL